MFKLNENHIWFAYVQFFFKSKPKQENAIGKLKQFKSQLNLLTNQYPSSSYECFHPQWNIVSMWLKTFLPVRYSTAGWRPWRRPRCYPPAPSCGLPWVRSGWGSESATPACSGTRQRHQPHVEQQQQQQLPATRSQTAEHNSRQVFKKFRSQHRNLHRMLEQRPLCTWWGDTFLTFLHGVNKSDHRVNHQHNGWKMENNFWESKTVKFLESMSYKRLIIIMEIDINLIGDVYFSE